MACEFYYKSPRFASFGCGVKFQYLQSGHLHSGRLLPSSLLLLLSCTPHKGFYAILKNFYGSSVPGYLDSPHVVNIFLLLILFQSRGVQLILV